MRTLTCGQQALVRCFWSATPTHVEAQRFGQKSWYALQTPTYALDSSSALCARIPDKCEIASLQMPTCPEAMKTLSDVSFSMNGALIRYQIHSRTRLKYRPIDRVLIILSVPFVRLARRTASRWITGHAHAWDERLRSVIAVTRPSPSYQKGPLWSSFPFRTEFSHSSINCADLHSPAFRAPFVLLMALVGHTGEALKRFGVT